MRQNGPAHSSGHGRMNVDAPILRVHTHTAWVPTCEANCSPNVDARGYPTSLTIWATTRTRHGRPTQRHNWAPTELHMPTTFVSVQTSPSISTRIHVSPPAPTKFWAPNLRLDSHVSGNSGHNWATLGHHDTTTKFWTSITLFGRPRKVLGLGRPHVATNCHDLFGRPRTCMVAHKLPTLDAQLRDIAQPHICMGSHEIFGRSHISVDGQDGTLLGDHTLFVDAQQRQVLGAQSCGQLHAFWATTTSWMEPHVIALGYHVIVWTST